MFTYQDFEKTPDRAIGIAMAIQQHMKSKDYLTAVAADLYDRQLNPTVNRVSAIYAGEANTDTGLKIASNHFNRLNTQRCAYLLGNGVSFTQKEMRANDMGEPVMVDVIKERLGQKFDTALFQWGYYALIHGKAFGFWDKDALRVFKLTEFAPLWDENTGALMAGVRFWRIDPKKPLQVEVYEADGVTEYRSREGTTGYDLVEIKEKRSYITVTEKTEATGVVSVSGRNYGVLPIVPMYDSALKQSTLVGIRQRIDSIDLVQSGYASDMRDVTKIYWLIQNCNGMTKEDQRKFLDDIRDNHIAAVDTASMGGDARGALTPYVNDVPFQGNEAYLASARAALYEDFGALDVHTISAGATNDHIDAAYQPLDEEADKFETQVIEAVQGILALIGIEDTPQFKRNRVSNVKEMVDSVMEMANYLDEEAVLDLIPFVTVDMKQAILNRRDRDNAGRLRLSDNPQTFARTEGDAQGEAGAV